MTPLFHPSLINGPFDDPGVYVDFLFERRAILFDLGDLSHLPARKLLRISHVFVSHTHVDHFIGFDHLTRICLGRDKRLHLFGPPGFIGQVGHRLAGYTWNLVGNYPTDFTIVATEVHPDSRAYSAEFHCMKGFMQEQEREETVTDGILFEDEAFLIRVAFLDHGTPCLAFAMEEKNHVNIMKNRLDALGLPTGLWLAELKRQVLRDAPDDAPFLAWWKEGERIMEREFTLGWLKNEILQIVPGQKIAYVTDTGFTRGNAEKIVGLIQGTDCLFIETTFLDKDAERAAERSHLTARQAGCLAGKAGVGKVIPFHFSPKYRGMEALLLQEVEESSTGTGIRGT